MELISVDTLRQNNLADYISRTDDNSDPFMSRLLITFKNGYKLSVIRGEYSYVGEDGLFEIAPKHPDGRMDGALLGFECDDVQGHLTEAEVMEKALILAKL
jgi:hypothetical protein